MNENYKTYLRKQEEFSKNYKSRHTYKELTVEEKIEKILDFCVSFTLSLSLTWFGFVFDFLFCI